MHYETCRPSHDKRILKIAQECCQLAESVTEAEELFWKRLEEEGFTGQYSNAGDDFCFVD